MKTYKRFRYPAEIISHAVWLYHCFTLSSRDAGKLLAHQPRIIRVNTEITLLKSHTSLPGTRKGKWRS